MIRRVVNRFSFLLAALVIVGCTVHAADDRPAQQKILEETVKRMPPEQAAAGMTVPAGFHVSLFAAEPDVRQPIAMATDARGRLWVAENNTYSDRHVNFDMSLRDRIIILEDTDHDGRADRHKVFWDRAQKLTSVEIGFGGVWALCPPQLLFIPDRNGDDIPDGEPQVVLDGWDDGVVRHNIANGLRWGPDGWLYGRHGIQAVSHVGLPGSLPSQRIPVSCGIWRYHPTRKIFEVVCRGTTNPWGMDWNDRGELFFINTVIGHLWHSVPGAHYRRMYGEDENAHLYGLIEQTADHFHWDTSSESWGAINKIGLSPTTDQAGGGHAHCGLMIYQGDNWPDRYRDTLFTVNMHGRRLNNDTLARQGSGYVGRHSADFLKSPDSWFPGIELIGGADGGVYLADWSDIGECHGSDGVHRDSGRIFKIVYGQSPRLSEGDIARLSDAELVALQLRKNDWPVRQSRRILQERAAAGRPMDQVHTSLRQIFATDPTPVHQLRAMWCLHVTGGASDSWLLAQLRHGDESVRSWAIRLLGDGKVPGVAARHEFAAIAPRESSGLVLLYLASALQQFPIAERWMLGEALAAREDFADDRVLPLMVWYGIEPSVSEDPARALRLVGTSRMPLVVRCIARRLTEDLAQSPGPVDGLVTQIRDAGQTDRSRAILTGMAEALRGWRKAPRPASWASLTASRTPTADEGARRLIRELSAVFGDGRAVDELMRVANSRDADLIARRDALRVLVEARTAQVVPLLRRLIGERDLGPDAVRGLAAFDDPTIPSFLVNNFHDLKEATRAAAVITLSSRPTWARSLLEAVAAGVIPRSAVPAFQVRQMAAIADESLHKQVLALWPEIKTISATKRDRIKDFQAKLNHSSLAAADASNGRKRFIQACATCHTLFGQGGKIGPDLSGAQRTNLNYLLENIVEPSATVTPAYRMSTVALTDGRVINGIVSDPSGASLTIQTPTERLFIRRTDVEEIRKSELSLMPEGLLEVLPEKEVRDLFAYLMSPRQVPLRDESHAHEAAARQ